MKKTLLLATKNSGKIKEIREILKDVPIKVISIEESATIPVDFKVKETGETFAQNASIKAQTFGKMARLLTLADDSGLEVDALGGRPGVKSARFTRGDDQSRYQRVLKQLQGIPQEERTARFKAVVAIFDPQTGKIHSFNGVAEGRVTRRPLGKGGFGYDPIFFSTELGKTFAQATLKEKNRISHRARALLKAKRFLAKRLKPSK